MLWGVVASRVALWHVTTEAVLAELRPNEGLRGSSVSSPSRVPKPWNISRFEDVLGQEPHRTLLKEVFNALIERLGIAVVDLGQHSAVTPRLYRHGASPRRPRTRRSRTDCRKPAVGKEYKDDEGRVTKVVEWFGFKLPCWRT